MTKKRAVLLPDGGPGVGLGHVVRCYALAEALALDGWESILAVKRDSFGALVLPEQPGLRICEAAAESWSVNSLAGRWPHGADLVVIDDYGMDENFERNLRTWAKSRLVFDDLLDRRHDCDWLVSIAPPQKATLPLGCDLLLGGAYAPLRREFWSKRLARIATNNALSSRMRDRIIVINLGGTPQLGLIEPILLGLAQLNRPLQIQLIAAGAEELVQDIQRTAPHLDIHLVTATERMADLLAEADLAIGAAGSSVWERAALGISAVSLIIADNQLATAELLECCGAGPVIDARQGLGAAAIARSVSALVDDQQSLHAISSRTASLADGLGARRIAVHIEPEHAADGTAVILRPAKTADMLEVYHWQLQPDTRRYANNPAVPSISDHEAWFARRLVDPRCLFNIIEYGSVAAGVLRLDIGWRGDTFCGVVSVNIDEAQTQKGIAMAALRTIRRLVPELPLHAEIDPRNKASLRLFQAAGYQQLTERWHVQKAAS